MLQLKTDYVCHMHNAGADPGGGARRRAPPKIGKNMIFFAQNRDFSHEIPQKLSCLAPLGAIFLSAPPPPNLKSYIRPCNDALLSRFMNYHRK